MPLTRVFQSGNSQAVRLPKEFRLNTNEVEILRRGEEIVLRRRQFSLRSALEQLSRLPPDALTAAEPTAAAPSDPRLPPTSALPPRTPP